MIVKSASIQNQNSNQFKHKKPRVYNRLEVLDKADHFQKSKNLKNLNNSNI
jgi:hypothetical protein